MKQIRGMIIALTLVGAMGATLDTAAAQQQQWSGFYAGIHAGGIWGDVSVVDAALGIPTGPFTYSPGGAFAGATAGYNIQFGAAVVGIEGDLGYMDLSGAGTIPSSHEGQHQDITLKSGAYGDITGRLGLVFKQTLFYGKGGVAFYTGSAKQATTASGYGATGTSGSFTGWTAGGGIEHFFAPNITLKLEYLHFDFGTKGAYQTALVEDPPTTVGTRFDNEHKLTADSIKLGLNFHF